jgi:hypothetical protein
MCFSSCRTDEVKLPDIPVLRADTLQTFQVGEQFMLIESSNSCCFYQWSDGKITSEVMPAIEMAEVTEVINDPADSDCAGCSSFTYHIMTCVQKGIDTLYHYTIPAGSGYMNEVSDTANYEAEIDLDKYEDAIKTMYIIQVK